MISYNKLKQIDPRWIILLIMILTVFFVNWYESKAQYFEIDKRNNACENMETAYVRGYYFDNVHTISWTIFYDSCNWNLISVGKNDVLIDGQYVEMIHPNRYAFSWISFYPLQYSDTLLSLLFERKGYIGGGEIEWSTDTAFACQISDYNAIPIPAVYSSGYLRCLTSGIKNNISKIKSYKYIYNNQYYIRKKDKVYKLTGERIK